LLSEDWHSIRDGLEVKLCPSPEGDETFVLCRSRDRREKEKAMHSRFEQRIEEGLQRIAASCEKQRQQPLVVAQRCQRAGLGDESRRVFEELGKIQLVDVVLPTRHGPAIRRRCVTQPTEHQAILLAHLKLNLPSLSLTDGM
jgi:hypothetical protein